MRHSRLRLGAAVTVATLAVALAAAAETEAPRVYTNADIERLFGPSKPSPAQVPTPEQDARAAAREAQDREFVNSFLDREYRKIADDQDRVARQREIDEASGVAPSQAYGLPWAYGSSWFWGQPTSPSRPHNGRTPYFSPYAPKPGQPGWNELVLQQHRAFASGSAGHQAPQGQPHPAPRGGQGHGGGRR